MHRKALTEKGQPIDIANLPVDYVNADIETAIAHAKKIAARLSEAHRSAIDRLTDIHRSDPESTLARMLDKRGTSVLFNKTDISIFDHNTAPQHNTWIALRDQLTECSKQLHLENANHNSLALLLTADNTEFVSAVELGRLLLESEFGHIAIHRLRDIANHDASLAKKARQLICSAYTLIAKESLVHFDEATLEHEFFKLALFSLLNPHDKIAILGTARAVEAYANAHFGETIYFNPPAEKYTWETNRSWLQAAVYLGFQFNLIEQHYPNIEEAILSCSTSKLIFELANEIRSSDTESQYNGTFSPTATPQEILALLDMGCSARKAEDNTLSLISPSQHNELSPKKACAIKRTHTSPHLYRSAPLPPLNNRKDHFKAPVIRKLNFGN